MQFSHPSCISVNTLVLWPSVPETLESKPYWDMIFIGFRTSGLLSCLLSTKQWGCWILPSSSFYSWKAIFFSPPQQASWHHSGLASLMATSWSKLIYTWTRQTREEEVFHTLYWHAFPPLLQMNPIWLRLSLCFISSLPLSFLLFLFFLLIPFNTSPSFQCLRTQL